MKNRILPVVLVAIALVVSLVLTGVSIWVYGRSESNRELARLSLEDVARRVTISTRNLKLVRRLNDVVALSRARALARLVEADPSVLDEDQRGRFEALAKDFGVDELHVADERGTLIRSLPKDYEGYSMASAEQSVAFMPAITNRAFELAQEPMVKGISSVGAKTDSALFQYAGVARYDRPGIVQVGMQAARLAEAIRIADVADIANTAHVGRHGKVAIVPRREAQDFVDGGFHHCTNEKGEKLLVLDALCEDWVIRVSMPDSHSSLASSRSLLLLGIIDVILLIFLFMALPSTSSGLVRELKGLRAQLAFRSRWTVALKQVVFSPLAAVSLGVFVVSILVLAVISTTLARSESKEVLAKVADDMAQDLDGCVDSQIEYIAQTICDLYERPEAMLGVDLKAMMRTYAIDEINVVNEKGICIASTVGVIVGQNQRRLRNPALFCKALLDEGRVSYSQPFRQSASESMVFRKYVGVAFPPPAKGYLQLGFDRVRLKDEFDFGLCQLAHNWHIGETGFFVISKTVNGQILSSGREEYDGQPLAAVGFDVFSARMKQNVENRDPETRELKGIDVHCFVARFGDDLCLCTSGVVNQFLRYTAAIPLSEVYGPSVVVVSTTAIVLFLVMILVVAFMTSLSDKHRALQVFIEKDREQRKKDLSVAAVVQASSLPVVFPDEPGWKIFAAMDTAREVGGDFYDFYKVPSGRVFMLVADVSGKGIPAAMFMMQARAIIRASVFDSKEMADAVAKANSRLAGRNDANMFVTAWFGAYDASTGEVEYVNAGHNPPLIKRANGSVEWVRARSGVALAAVPGAKYRSEFLHLAPGDSLFLYTDGVTEAQNPFGDFFGEQRLEDTLRLSGVNFIEECREAIRGFADGAERSDDITMLALDVKTHTQQKDQ